MLTFLLCPDKFKGSATSEEVIKAISTGLQKVLPDASIKSKAISDGGEGFAEIASQYLQGKWVSVDSLDALHRPIKASYYVSDNVAYIDMASTNGLIQIELNERAPIRSSTIGTGMLIKHATEHSAVDKIYIGLGGSATNDGGAGMAHALGVQFLDIKGKILNPKPSNLRECSSISRSELISLPPIIAACDVSNPLLEKNGATAVYGPQKGIEDINKFECILKHLMEIDAGSDHAITPGAGAAGGLAYGLLHYCGAQLESGFDLITKISDLELSISSSDIIITGEGSLDAQTLNGKGPHGVATIAAKHNKKILAIAGRSEACATPYFDKVYTLSELGLPLQICMENAPDLIEKIAETLALDLKIDKLAD